MDFPRHYNAAGDFIDRNVDAGLADKPAFIDPTRSLTYGELARATRQMGNVLAGLDVGREARVALLMHDTVDWPIAFWGAIRAGVVPVAINTMLGPAQYEYMLADSRAQALFVSHALLAQVEPCLDRLPHLRHVIVAGGDCDVGRRRERRRCGGQWLRSHGWGRLHHGRRRVRRRDDLVSSAGRRRGVRVVHLSLPVDPLEGRAEHQGGQQDQNQHP